MLLEGSPVYFAVSRSKLTLVISLIKGLLLGGRRLPGDFELAVHDKKFHITVDLRRFRA